MCAWKCIIYEIRFSQFTLSEYVKHVQNNPRNIYNECESEEIISIITKESIVSTKFNCSNRFSFDVVPWDESNDFFCWRSERNYDGVNNYYSIPNVVSTIFSANRSLIFGEFRVTFKFFNQNIKSKEKHKNISCKISVKRMDLDKEIVKNFVIQLSVTGFSKTVNKLIVLPTPIIVEDDVKYKIQLEFLPNNNIQLKHDEIMEQEAELSYHSGYGKRESGSKITFHRDRSSNFDALEKGVITQLMFNEIESRRAEQIEYDSDFCERCEYLRRNY